jgi:5-methylcytosine-specific restriction endonuclease McrA
MTSYICYLCPTPLNGENISDEHIIPDSIGGRLKTDTLLCDTCNKKTGQLFDSVFAKYGNILASKYNIKRDRGNVQTFIAKEKKPVYRCW